MARVAARQESVITRAQLRSGGLTDRQIQAWVRKGLLYPLHRGVYAYGHPNVSGKGRLLAALFALGPDAFLSHRTAAALLGLRPLDRSRIEVTIPSPKAERRAGLIVHRTRHPLVRDELRTSDGLRHSSFARMLVESTARETDSELIRLIEEGVRKRLFILDKVEAMLARHARAPGIARLRSALTTYVDRSDRTSALERAFDRELAQRPHLPAPERNVHITAGGINWEIDCLWREQRVIVELDGRPWHVCQRDMEKDKLKDMKLAAAGYLPVRVTGRRFERDPAAVFDDLGALLTVRRAAAG